MLKCCNLVFNYDPIFGIRISTIGSMEGHIISTSNKRKVKTITTNVPTNLYLRRKPSIRK